MARAVLPNPSARAEWLFASISHRALQHWGHVLALDGGPGDHDLDVSETDTVSTVSLRAASLQRFNRGMCAHLLRDLAATADLPPHSALFPKQQLDLTHRWWSEAEGPDIDVNDVYPLAAADYISIKLYSAKYTDLAPFQLPDLRQPARSLTDLLTTLAAFPGRRQPHNAPPLHSAQTVHEVVAEEYRILESVSYELVTNIPAHWVSLFEVRFSLRVQHLRRRSPQVTGSLL